MPFATASPCCSTSAWLRVPWTNCWLSSTLGFTSIFTGRAAVPRLGRTRKRRRGKIGGMETKSPYVLIGAAVMLFIAAIVGFVVWKLRAGDNTAYAYYRILFSGEVQGLSRDSQVYYRGL